MTAREQVLKMLRLQALGQQISTEELLRLAAAIEEREMEAEQTQPEPKPEALPEIPAPIIPSLDEAAAIASERKGVKAIDPAKLSRLKFEDAANAWCEANRHRWRKRMAYGVAHAIKQLGKFFAGTRLDAIHIGHILAYQEERTTNSQGRWNRTAGVSCVNHEVNYLSQILRTAGLWEPLAKLYTPLQSEGFKKPKVMDDVEKRRFFVTAASRPEWSLALWVATITANTSASGVELRNLQLADLLLDDATPRLIVNAATAKCQSRGRSIELNGPALEAILKCVERARELGAVRPEHYLFPKRDSHTKKWNPAEPASDSWLRKSWERLRVAAGVPWLTPHCLRHQCITELGEKGVAPEVIRQIAGHVSEEMMRHYTHARRHQQASALKLLEPYIAQPRRKRKPAQRTGVILFPSRVAAFGR